MLGELGQGPLIMPPDVDGARAFFRQKSKRMVPKVQSVKEAVSEFVKDGDYIAMGGFGGNRIPTAAVHEIIRQGRKNLGFSGHSTTHDFQLLAAGNCIDRCDVAYVVGMEARGLSKVARRLFESGHLQVAEWSNAGLAWRYKAAAMGVPFLPCRVMAGTDTGRYSAAKNVACPFTGTRLVAVPALYPDVAVIHVHRADVYGNCQIDGILISDWDLARAARYLIITTERLIPNEEIRREPTKTAIPGFLVDAVCEVPYGSYPGNMPYEYFSDEEHLMAWLEAESDEETFRAFLDRHIYEVKDFSDYLQVCGGLHRLKQLRAVELLVDLEGKRCDA